MEYIEELNKFLKKLPPYNKILGDQIINLDDILNSYSYFFEDGMDYEDYAYGQFNEDTVNEFGSGEKDEAGNYSIHLYKFHLWQTYNRVYQGSLCKVYEEENDGGGF